MSNITERLQHCADCFPQIEDNPYSVFVDAKVAIESLQARVAAVDDLYEALEISAGILQSLVEEYPGHLKELHTVKTALAKAKGK